MEFFQKLFETDFMPHGHCYLWSREVLWLNVISDAIIAISYFAIPFALAYFVQRRAATKGDMQFSWVIYLFAAFILLCGTTHVLDVITVWKPYYRVEGIVKAVTAVVSLGTAVALVRLIPLALALPSQKELQAKNEALENEIGRRKEAEEGVRQTSAALERSNQELENFAYYASHDLKAPLRAIENLAKWIEEDAGDVLPDASRENIALMRRRVDRMKDLIGSLLEYSRVGRKEGRPEEVDVTALLNELVFIQNLPAGFHIEVAPDLPRLRAPRGALNRVFGNLITNAVKYHDRPDGRIEITGRVTGGLNEYVVKDDGPGIAPEYHERIFGMFQMLQSRDQVDGTGMGLALVKKTVEHHGGTVRIESAAGQGAAFHLTWPNAGAEGAGDGA